MIRSALCTLMLLGFASAVPADELDKEFAPKTGASPTALATATPGGSELDQESPAQACHWRGGWGYGSFYGGYGGYGGYGYSPIGYSSFGYGYSPVSISLGYSPIGYYGGFSPSYYSYRNFGYSPFFGSRYYSTGFYGGLGFGGYGYSSYYRYRGFGPRWGLYW